MYQRHEVCPLCGLSTTPSDMIRHKRSHENGNFEKRPKVRYKLDHDDLNCKFCGKECKNRNALIQHEIRCKDNPEKLENTGKALLEYVKNNPSWCKGKTAETDERVAKRKETYRNNHPLREKDPLEVLLDDDGLLYEKYKAKCYNGKFQGHPCLLTIHEYCLLMQEAGIVSSQLGYRGENYDLARYNDEGPYAIGNCRFITHQENVKERKSNLESIGKALEAQLKDRKENPEKYKEIGRKAIANSAYFQEKIRIGKEKEALRQANVKKDHSNYGRHWITNGLINKLWDPKSGEIPEGFHLGKIQKKKE